MHYLINITAALFAFPLVLAVYMLVITGHTVRTGRKLYYKLCGKPQEEWSTFLGTDGTENSNGTESPSNMNSIATLYRSLKRQVLN